MPAAVRVGGVQEKVDFDQLWGELELLKRLGYKKFKVVQQSDIPGTKLRTRTIDGREFDMFSRLTRQDPLEATYHRPG